SRASSSLSLHDALPIPPLAHGAVLLLDALAAPVADGGGDLDPLEVGLREAPRDDSPRRLGRDALPCCARAHPVAQVRDPGLDVRESARAEEPPTVENAELKARAVVPAAQRRANPLLRVGQRIRRLAPVHPTADLDARLVDGTIHR